MKGTYILAYYFIKTFGGEGTLIHLVSMGASFTVPGISSYSSSKLATIKLGEYLDLGKPFIAPYLLGRMQSLSSTTTEQPNLRVFSVHPGIVAQTDSKRGMVVDAFTPFAHDNGIQTGGVTLYLATPKADYLRGSFVSVNCRFNRFSIQDMCLISFSLTADKLPQGTSKRWRGTRRRLSMRSCSNSLPSVRSSRRRDIRGPRDGLRNTTRLATLAPLPKTLW